MTDGFYVELVLWIHEYLVGVKFDFKNIVVSNELIFNIENLTFMPQESNKERYTFTSEREGKKMCCKIL